MWRITGQLRFTISSGMGQWCFDQNVVRLSQAVDLLPSGQYSNEMSSHQVTSDGHYICDLIFPANKKRLAEDTFATITDASVTNSAWMHPITIEQYSEIRVHECHHDSEPPIPCTNVINRWTDNPSEVG